MPSITSWNRVEPRPRSSDMTKALQARVHDPLWLLARQWQIGEFRGSDGGSPVEARLRARCDPVTRIRPAAGPAAGWLPYDPATAPLEALVEGERARRGDNAAAAGQRFLDLLADAGLAAHADAFRTAYPGPSGIAGAVPDGHDVYRAISDATEAARLAAAAIPDAAARAAALGGLAVALPQVPVIPAADLAAATRAAAAWMGWYEARFAAVRAAAEAGLHFLRMLRIAGLGYAEAYRQHYRVRPLTPVGRAVLDVDSIRVRDLLAGRAPDGAQLYADLRGALGRDATGTLPPLPPIAPADHDAVAAVARSWIGWYESLAGAALPSSWTPERLEYSFAIATSQGDPVLSAPEYHGGRLDWYSFVKARSTEATAPGPVGVPVVRTTVPAPVSFRGMPASRWWEMEDGVVDFGAVDAAAEDLVRMLLIEFALVYGNDWFVIPVELPVGSVCRISSLVVTDTFGEHLLVRESGRSGEGKPWRMFQIAPPGTEQPRPDGEGVFFLAPVVAAGPQGAALEDVRFHRDEMANMAWAVEHAVEGAAGRPVDRHRHEQELRAGAGEVPAPAGDSTVPHYRMATSVPEHWIPLLPGPVGPGAIRLQRGAMLRPLAGGATERVLPRGEILEPDRAGLWFFEEEVPRAGVRITRGYQLVRWTNGSTCLWMGRAKHSGRGEGSSGLRFDVVSST